MLKNFYTLKKKKSKSLQSKGSPIHSKVYSKVCSQFQTEDFSKFINHSKYSSEISLKSSLQVSFSSKIFFQEILDEILLEKFERNCLELVYFVVLTNRMLEIKNFPYRKFSAVLSERNADAITPCATLASLSLRLIITRRNMNGRL